MGVRWVKTRRRCSAAVFLLASKSLRGCVQTPPPPPAGRGLTLSTVYNTRDIAHWCVVFSSAGVKAVKRRHYLPAAVVCLSGGERSAVRPACARSRRTTAAVSRPLTSRHGSLGVALLHRPGLLAGPRESVTVRPQPRLPGGEERER